MHTVHNLPGHLPTWESAPLDYRYALDAAITALAHRGGPLVRCHVPQLAEEVRQRIGTWNEQPVPETALWVEPLQEHWQSDLAEFRSMLPAGSPLVIVASRPLARLLAARRSWTGIPLGLRPGGLNLLRRHLRRENFNVEQQYAIHSLASIRLNALSRLAARLGRPDLGDRLHYAARLHYCAPNGAGQLSTVALLFTRRGSS